MKSSTSAERTPRLVLEAATAADLMTPNPVSIAADATVREAAAFLARKGFSAAPVIEEAGRPVGVLSQSDLVIHDREKIDFLIRPPYYARADLGQGPARDLSADVVVDADRTPVRNVMTPLVFSVAPRTAAHKVIEDMLAHKIHRLFVVDDSGILVGVISAVDVLRRLHSE
jgi:CBS domain-containing protein